MDLPILLAICSVVAIAIVIFVVKNQSNWSGTARNVTSAKVPGLNPTKASGDQGNLVDIARAGSLHQFLMGLHKQYGPIAGFWWGKQHVVSVASPSIFKRLVHVFDRPPELFKLFEPVITSDSIQYANHEDGGRRRHVYDKAFSYTAIAEYYSSFQKVAEEVSMKWAVSCNSDDHIPLHKLMIDLAIQAIALIAFGELFEDKENINRFQNSYNLVWEVVEQSLTKGFPEPGTDRYHRFQTGKCTMHRIIQEMIHQKQAQGAERDQVLFIDYLMSLDSPVNQDRVFADGFAYMLGGFHTTGNMLTWAFYFLARDQVVQEKLATEIQNVLGGENVNHENINNLTYLRQVQEETLRCSVLVPWGARVQEEDVELGGYLVPKQTPIITALGVMLQDEKYWPDPDRFDPERFSAENIKKRPAHVFSPFGVAGKRICPGYRFAYVETAIVLATLVGRFRFKLVEDQSIKHVYGLVTHVSEEVWLTVARR